MLAGLATLVKVNSINLASYCAAEEPRQQTKRPPPIKIAPATTRVRPDATSSPGAAAQPDSGGIPPLRAQITRASPPPMRYAWDR